MCLLPLLGLTGQRHCCPISVCSRGRRALSSNLWAPLRRERAFPAHQAGASVEAKTASLPSDPKRIRPTYIIHRASNKSVGSLIKKPRILRGDSRTLNPHGTLLDGIGHMPVELAL